MASESTRKDDELAQVRLLTKIRPKKLAEIKSEIVMSGKPQQSKLR